MKTYSKYPGLQRLIDWYETLDDDTMSRFREPYAIVRHEKASGRDNLIPNRRAKRHLERLDERVADLVWRDMEYSDRIHNAPEQSEIERRREKDRIRQAEWRARQV